MKNKIMRVVLLAAAAVWAVWSVVSGVAGLAKSGSAAFSKNAEKGTVCEMKVLYAKEIYNIDHKLNVILPLGTERFFFVMGTDGKTAPLLVKASREWFEENFTELGLAKSAVTVKGEVREFSSRNSSKLGEINAKLAQADESFSVSQSKYVNSLYKQSYIMRLIMGALAISVGVVIAVLMSSRNLSGKAEKIMAIWIIVAVLGMLALGLGSRVV